LILTFFEAACELDANSEEMNEAVIITIKVRVNNFLAFIAAPPNTFEINSLWD